MSEDKAPLTDERGILIEEWDVLKVFHFVAAKRREKVYMYKQVRKFDGFLFGHHLCEGEFGVNGENCFLLVGDKGVNSGKMKGVRVVESSKWEKL